MNAPKIILFVVSALRIAIGNALIVALVWLMMEQLFEDAFSSNRDIVILMFVIFPFIALVRHVYNLPQGWEQYYTRWGNWRNRTVTVPKSQMAAAWPHIKDELRKLQYPEIKKVSATRFHLNNTSALWRHQQASLFLKEEGDNILLTCSMQFPKWIAWFAKLFPELDAGTAMQVLQAVERGWQRTLQTA